jgi:hypothetical protein
VSVQALKDQAQVLVSQAGAGIVESVNRVLGGRNNQVFKVETTSGGAFALKIYFSHAEDRRDRLGAEYAFCRYAWAEGLRCIPEPVAADHESRTGLYAWVSGAAPDPSQVSNDAIGKVLSFLVGLNGGRHTEAATNLPLASEACLSINAHVETVGNRLDTLIAGLGDDSLERKARQFLKELQEIWNTVRSYVESTTRGDGVGSGQLIQAQQCISPSDLGFHNALVNTDGEFTFLDFEYAGWDDPAKLVCDFFHQEKVPVSRAYYNEFRDRLVAGHPDPENEAGRIDRLMPVYGVKWLIMRLNEFRPDGAYRRAFADPQENPEERKVSQLEKAYTALEALKAELEETRIL